MRKSKTVILIAKIFENLLELKFDELLNEIYIVSSILAVGSELSFYFLIIKTVFLVFLFFYFFLFLLYIFTFIEELRWIVTLTECYCQLSKDYNWCGIKRNKYI